MLFSCGDDGGLTELGAGGLGFSHPHIRSRAPELLSPDIAMRAEAAAQTREFKLQLNGDALTFRAAHPEATFADFIKHISPTDIARNGDLSMRMLASGNPWFEAWDAAVAANREQTEPHLIARQLRPWVQ